MGYVRNYLRRNIIFTTYQIYKNPAVELDFKCQNVLGKGNIYFGKPDYLLIV